MQPSNTSHNDVSFAGILQTYVDALSRNPRGQQELVGQQVAKLHESTIAIIAMDGADDIHLLVSADDNKEDTRLSNLDLRGLKVTNRKLAVAGHPVRNYLDIVCATGKTPSFRRPFLRFAEDVLFEISKSAEEPRDAIYRTGIRWRRFWTADTSEITVEWLHGIFGELLFIKDVIEKCGVTIIKSWMGPLGKDHDFQINNNLGIEVKSSTEMPFQVNCNIRQLDTEIFKQLYLVCYRILPSDEGQTLPDLVSQIENFIGHDENILDVFYERLAASGYRRDLEVTYRETIISVEPPNVFFVDESFPKITEKSFLQSPDHRITNIRYTLKITGVKKLELETLIKEILSTK
ncbi:MAG: hypothetical protein Greene041619_319 [Candidatus Peregrinibacteria bacterium Greene0416_19]|nr:MAG: hypothetical protein Greene041619_319 [Candidatus Peregrinibacteria bacterium Greene0416_19]